jgi:hypothetical protein
MATPPYPLSHIPAKKSRLDRNAGWKIPLGCLIVVVFFGGFLATIFTIVETSFRKSEIYHEAINRAEQSSQIANRIGVPLRPGRVLQGQLNASRASDWDCHFGSSAGTGDDDIPRCSKDRWNLAIPYPSSPLRR